MRGDNGCVGSWPRGKIESSVWNRSGLASQLPRVTQTGAVCSTSELSTDPTSHEPRQLLPCTFLIDQLRGIDTEHAKLAQIEVVDSPSDERHDARTETNVRNRNASIRSSDTEAQIALDLGPKPIRHSKIAQLSSSHQRTSPRSTAKSSIRSAPQRIAPNWWPASGTIGAIRDASAVFACASEMAGTFTASFQISCSQRTPLFDVSTFESRLERLRHEKR